MSKSFSFSCAEAVKKIEFEIFTQSLLCTTYRISEFQKLVAIFRYLTLLPRQFRALALARKIDN